MSDIIFYAMTACVLAQLVLVLIVLRLHREEELILDRQIEVLKRVIESSGNAT